MQSGRRAGEAIEVPPQGKRALFGDLQGLEYAVSNQQTMITSGNRGLTRIVVDDAVQPDPEVLGQDLRARCGELHADRLSGNRDHDWLFGRLALCSPRTRLDSGLSLGYGF